MPHRRGAVRAAAGASLLAAALAVCGLAAAAAAPQATEATEAVETAAAPEAAEAAAGLSAAERRGKQLYLTGESATGGEVVALMGEARIEVPASALPCAGCHGRDGRGRPEGGVDPSDLTWEALTRPYAVETASGRTRGPYDETRLIRAIALGVDSAGNELDAVMPRYRLSREDAADLVAYVRRLGRDPDPGVGADRLTLGVLLAPEGGPFAAASRAVRGVVDAWAAQSNADGGFYGRRVALRHLVLPADPAARPAAVDAFLDAAPTFALVAPFLAGADRDLADLAARREIPVLGPLTLEADESFPLNRQVFYLDGGLPAQAAALVAVAARRPDAAADGSGDGGGDDGDETATTGAASGARTAALLHPAGERFAELAAAMAERLAAAGFEVVDRTLPAGDPAPVVAELRAAGAGDLFVIAPGDEEAPLLAAVAAAGWAPRAHLLGSFADPALLAGGDALPGPLFVAFTSLPGDRTPAGLKRYRRRLGLAEDAAAALPDATEIAAYAALDLLAEGLRSVGRDLSREGLIEALETVHGHPTGLLPPLTYGPNRRVGARGAWVLEVGPEGPVRAEWVEPAPN